MPIRAEMLKPAQLGAKTRKNLRISRMDAWIAELQADAGDAKVALEMVQEPREAFASGNFIEKSGYCSMRSASALGCAARSIDRTSDSRRKERFSTSKAIGARQLRPTRALSTRKWAEIKLFTSMRAHYRNPGRHGELQ